MSTGRVTMRFPYKIRSVKYGSCKEKKDSSIIFTTLLQKLVLKQTDIFNVSFLIMVYPVEKSDITVKTLMNLFIFEI